MPRKENKEEKVRPAYLNADGTLNWTLVFQFQPKQLELLKNVMRDGKVYVQPVATQCLSVGGIRSGKTCGWLMYFIKHYCMAFSRCDILILRRTFKELESGAIADFKTFMPPELYDYDQTKHVATLTNGSRVVFGHCQNNKDRDIEQYLGQAYPAILVDECGQFSPDAWMMLYSRNTINASCQPDEKGNFPIPCIVGCTNPLGPFYEYYRTIFVEKEPWMKPEEARKDIDGTWWIPESGEWRCIYDPKGYACQRSTVFDNAALLKRDPAIVTRLMSMPKAKRDKVLYGLDGTTEGQYFDCWDPWYHVINLREDPEAILWQEHQDVWVGQDWGMGHANAAYFFTKALVRWSTTKADYRLKTVCFAEVVTTGGKTMKELASILASRAHLPNGKAVKVKAIYFSHEKFSRVMEARTPADEYSRVLREFGLPPVSRGTMDRIGSASLMYNMIKNGELVVLDSCKDIILSIPSLMRNPKCLDDVLKVDAKGDDCYDGFRLGVYGQLGTRKKPDADTVRDQAAELAKTDPFAAHFYKLKKEAELKNKTLCFKPPEQPVWVGKQQQ
jgi:hypothetical protein